MTERLLASLQILVLGWGGIFLVLFLIYLVSLALRKLFPAHEDKER